MSEIRNRPMTFPSFVFCYRLLGRICDFILNVAVRVGAGRRRRYLNFSFTKMSKIRQVDKTKCLISLTCVLGKYHPIVISKKVSVASVRWKVSMFYEETIFWWHALVCQMFTTVGRCITPFVEGESLILDKIRVQFDSGQLAKPLNETSETRTFFFARWQFSQLEL